MKVMVGESLVEFRAGNVACSYNLDSGRFSLSSISERRLSRADNLYASLKMGNYSYDTVGADLRKPIIEGQQGVKGYEIAGERVAESVRIQHSFGQYVRVELLFSEELDGLGITMAVENLGHKPIKVREMLPFVLEGKDGGFLNLNGPYDANWRVFLNGWQSWSPTGSVRLTAPLPVLDTPQSRCRNEVYHQDFDDGRSAKRSHWFGAIYNPQRKIGLFTGLLEMRSQVGYMTTVAKANSLDTITFTCEFDDKPLLPGERLCSQPLLVMWLEDHIGTEASRALELYTKTVGNRMGAPVKGNVPTGWCSWYYYFTGVSEADVLSNVDVLRQRKKVWPVEYVQIDDGYQQDIGDWLTSNRKFPHGMSYLARAIKEAGFKPGLWLAPFLVSRESSVYRTHPDWVVCGDDNKPITVLENQNWPHPCYALDCSNPDVLEWLTKIFRTVVDEWGFEYVKIDFLYAAAIKGRRYNNEQTRAEVYRCGLETIRKAVGTRFILGCGAPLGPGIGIFDANRIGADVAPYWSSSVDWSKPASLNAIHHILTRSYMHQALWVNDPDCLMVRREDSKLTQEEVYTLTTVIALSGGMLFISDDLTKLAPERADLLSRVLPPIPQAGRAIDLFGVDIPTMFMQEITTAHANWTLLAIFNWDEKTRRYKFDVDFLDKLLGCTKRGWHVFDVWAEEYQGIIEAQDLQRGEVDAVIPSHGCKLYAIRPVLNEIQLVGTNLHYSQGGVEIIEWTPKSDGSVVIAKIRTASARGLGKRVSLWFAGAKGGFLDVLNVVGADCIQIKHLEKGAAIQISFDPTGDEVELTLQV